MFKGDMERKRKIAIEKVWRTIEPFSSIRRVVAKIIRTEVQAVRLHIKSCHFSKP